MEISVSRSKQEIKGGFCLREVKLHAENPLQTGLMRWLASSSFPCVQTNARNTVSASLANSGNVVAAIKPII